MSQMDLLVEAVKSYAEEHYEEDGWDFVVECFSDADIAEWLERYGEGASTPKEAIEVMRAFCKIKDEQRAEIESTAF